MGYTHYWEASGPTPSEAFGRLGMDARTLFAEAQVRGMALGDGSGGGSPEISEGGIWFNGSAANDEDYETFAWEALPESFAFCKTGRRPYDEVVTAFLLRAKHYYGDSIAISSDGYWDDWKPGRQLYVEVFGEDPTCPWGNHEKDAA